MTQQPEPPPSGPPLEGSTRAANSVLLLALRRLRPPLLVILLAYSISIFGMTLIPGSTPDGVPAAPLSFFHALYFVSYTATTIGFGEVPTAFNDAQRMWSIVVIHLSVIGWAYGLASAIALINDPGFRKAVRQLRFRRAVLALREPFYLISGVGDTGHRLARLLDRLGIRFVVVDREQHRIDELELEDLRIDAPMLQVDVRFPQALLMAGLRHPQCMGVLAVDPDDDTNLAVVTAARLLNRTLPVIAGAESPRTLSNMKAFGVPNVISPFDAFAANMMLAMRSPGSYRLVDWLTAPDDTQLEGEHQPPHGDWVICGYGRFGHAVGRRLLERGCPVVAVDPAHADVDRDADHVRSDVADTAGSADVPPTADEAASEASQVPGGAGGTPNPTVSRNPHPLLRRIAGAGTETRVLDSAGVATAAGLVVATDNDVRNMAVAALARTLNPKIFIVLRQNDAANDPLFKAFRADLVMRPSEIIADECVALLTAPLLERFLAIVRDRDDAWCDEVIHQLRRRIGKRSPRAWTVRIDSDEAPAVCDLLSRNMTVTLGHLLRDPGARGEPLEAYAPLLLREGHDLVLPKDDTVLRVDDRILFLGRGGARRRQNLSLFDQNVLRYVSTGRDVPGGWVLQKLFD